MDSEHSVKDVIRCDLCETHTPPMHCDICHINLCKACVVDHLSDESKDHKVVSFDKRGSTFIYPECQKHSYKICEVRCNSCNVPICASCISSGDHDKHERIEFLKIVTSQKIIIEKDLEELKKTIYPKYQEAASNIPVQKADVRSHSKKLTTAIHEQGEALRTEIDNIIQEMKSEIDEMDGQHIAAIDEQEDAINNIIIKIKQAIIDLQELLESYDVCHVSEYISLNEEFNSLPAQFEVTSPTFIPREINREHICQQIGSLSKLALKYPAISITDDSDVTTEEQGSPMKTTNTVVSLPAIDDLAIKTEEQDSLIKASGAVSSLQTRSLTNDPDITREQDDPLKTPGAVSSPPKKLFLDAPLVLNNINTSGSLRSVSCLSDSLLWTCGGEDKMMKLYNLQGDILKSVKTKSESAPWDIAVTRNRNLLYTDYDDRSINLVRGTKIQTLFKLREWFLWGWRPQGVCSTAFGDFLVIMESDDGKHTKVERYSCPTKMQIVQWDDDFKPLYSSGGINNHKYLTENKNFDICVADYRASAVVVVSAAGKYRFRYTGSYKTQKAFYPYGITTDSQANILAADCDNHRIHIIDQNGHFLRHIDNSGLRNPLGLCVDSSDNLFVAECRTGKVKKIKYYL